MVMYIVGLLKADGSIQIVRLFTIEKFVGAEHAAFISMLDSKLNVVGVPNHFWFLWLLSFSYGTREKCFNHDIHYSLRYSATTSYECWEDHAHMIIYISLSLLGPWIVCREVFINHVQYFSPLRYCYGTTHFICVDNNKRRF